MDKRLETLLAKQAIGELSSRYMRGLDRRDRDLLLAQFGGDGWCEYGFMNASSSIAKNLSDTPRSVSGRSAPFRYMVFPPSRVMVRLLTL